jgi:hypothetical protein
MSKQGPNCVQDNNNELDAMKKKNLLLVACIALAVLGTWTGRSAWRAYRQIVSLDVHNAPLREVLSKIERQTWKKMHSEKALDARITLHVQDKPLAYVLDRICEQAGARWSTLFAVYGSASALRQLTATLQESGKLEPAGWSQVAPKAPADELAGPDSDAPHILQAPGSDGPGPMGYRPGTMMLRRTPNGQVFIQGGGKDGTEFWSPEELVMESSLKDRRAGDAPETASVAAAAETARKVHGKWTTCFALRKSIMGIGFRSPRSAGGGADPLRRGPNDRFARLTPDQRVQQARQRSQSRENITTQTTN